jgi:predicted amidohydrolase YtcJ
MENYRHYTKNYQSEYVNPTAVKLLADGVPEAHTAFMVDDYADRPGDRGSPMTSPEQLTAYVKAANSNGIAVHIHAIGDAAIDMSLTAIAEAGNSELGWQNAIAHMDFVRPEDIARLKTLQVTAQKSIQWATVDPSYYGIGKFVGMETMERAYPAKSILEAGGNLSLGSDWPSAAYLSTFKPFTLIEIAQTRRLPGYTEGPIRGESERISLMQSLYAITMGSARQLGIADKVGSLEVGKRADLIMLAEDIFTQPSNEINTNYSVLTMLDGKVVYQGE